MSARTSPWWALALLVSLVGTALALEPADEPQLDQDLDPAAEEPAPDDDPNALDEPPDPRTRELDELIAKLNAEEEASAKELGELGPKLETTRKLIVLRGRAYYRLLQAGLLPAGAGFDAVVDHAAKVERMRLALARDVSTEASLGHRKTELEAKLEQVRTQRIPLEVQRRAILATQDALDEAEAKRIAFEEAFLTSSRPQRPSPPAGSAAVAEPSAFESFRSLRGRLPFPIAGDVQVQRASRKDHQGPGLELIAPIGTAVRAVALGRVAFADSYDSYGLTVILDHGDNYYSVYGGLASTELHVGESVDAQGRVGSTGATEGRGLLYFELRQKAETIDPGPWFGL